MDEAIIPRLYSKIMFTYDGTGMSLDDLDQERTLGGEYGISAKIYSRDMGKEKENVVYLVNTIKGGEYKETNLLNTIGSDVKMAKKIMDYDQGVMPINYIFENKEGESDEVYVAFKLEHEEKSLHEWLEDKKFDSDSMEQW